MSKLAFILAGALVVAAAITLLILQHEACVRLRGENLSLREQIDQLTPLIAENERLSNGLARAQSSRVSSASQIVELGNLQTEIDAQKDEIQKLRSELAAKAAVPAFQKLPGNIRCISLAKGSWAFAGYTTPEAAFQSMLWAALQGDVNAIRASITPAEQERRMKGEWKDKTDSEIAEASMQRLSKATGFQILNIQMFSEDQAHFTVYINGLDQPDQPLWMDMRRIDGEWKSDASEHHREGP